MTAIACRQGLAQIKIELGDHGQAGNALQRWLQANGLLAISLGVLGVAIALSLLLVVGGYFIALFFS